MRLLHANIRSFRSNIDKLTRIIDIFEPDIFGLNETHFEKQMNFETFKTSSTTYTYSNHIFRDNNNVRSPPISGTSVFAINKPLIKSSFQSSDHEIINCKVSNKNGKPLNLIYAYLSPSSSKNKLSISTIKLLILSTKPKNLKELC